MKAKLYVFEEKMEAKFEDGTSYIPIKGESQEDFTKRLESIVKDDYLDDEFKLTVIDAEKVASNDDAALLEAFETAEGLQKKLIQHVLAERGVIKIKVAKPKLQPKTAEEMKASDHYKECEANIGKYVSFSPFKSTEVLSGKIAGIALNKTNTIVYYTVVLADGKRKCCACKSETLKFIAAPKEEAKKPAANKTEEKKEDVKTSKTVSKSKTNSDKKNQPGNDLDDAGDDLS